MNLSGDLITGALAAGLTLAYAIFAHYASVVADVGAWAILLAAAPMIVVGFAFARESRWGALFLALTVSALTALAWFWPNLHNPVAWLYFLQSVSANVMLGLIFWGSLGARRKPLCTVFASAVHDEMTPELLRYTRQVTLAWSLFFLSSALLSLLLFFLAPIETWSLFANILSWPLIGVMFLGENEVRKRVLPPRDHVGLRATVRAFRANFRP
jgi:uncharacterized membrane protein